jgi:hypothetical protein
MVDSAQGSATDRSRTTKMSFIIILYYDAKGFTQAKFYWEEHTHEKSLDKLETLYGGNMDAE